jgi:hypothetical protein
MTQLRIKIVEINGDRKGGDLSLRELNIILEQFITREVKEITLGKWSVKKLEILSMDVFENNNHRLSEHIEPESHVGEQS